MFYVTNVRALNSLSCTESPINRLALVKGHFIEFISRLGFIRGELWPLPNELEESYFLSKSCHEYNNNKLHDRSIIKD